MILGESKGKKDYFRAFATTVPKLYDHKDRSAQLLPHRMKKTMRLYGVSPLLLLKKSKYRVKSTAKSKKNDLQSIDKSFKLKPARKSKLPVDSLRAVGPEIAPNFGEANEFDFVEAEYFGSETESPIVGEVIASGESSSASKISANESHEEV